MAEEQEPRAGAMKKDVLREIVRTRYLPEDYAGWDIRTLGERNTLGGIAFDFVLHYKRPDRSMGEWQHIALCLNEAPPPETLEKLLEVMEEENLSGGTLYLAPGVAVPSELFEDLRGAGLRIRDVEEA